MHEKLINIIYYYTFNYKLPDAEFIDKIVNIIINNDDLESYVNNISYDYNYTASYSFVSKILKFNINNIIKYTRNSLKFYCDAYDLKEIKLFEEYVYICYEFVYTILHEFEHIKQIKFLENNKDNSFVSNLIQNNIDTLSINPDLYMKDHDLFPIERMAIINSNLEVMDILKLDSDVFFILNNIYVNRYNSFTIQHYVNGSYPLLEYVTVTNTNLYYKELLINSNNTKKILKKSKSDISFKDRLLLGLPITQKELNEIKK